MAIPKDDGVSWHLLLIFIGAALSVAGGAIWLGSNTNQITVNTIRIDKLEKFRDDGREEIADLKARMNSMERRIERVERLHEQPAPNR